MHCDTQPGISDRLVAVARRSVMTPLALVLGATTIIAASPADAKSKLQVLEAKCARAIVAREAKGIVDCLNFQLPGPLYVWVRVRGDSEALNELATGREIVIHHKWIRWGGPSGRGQSIEATTELPLGTIAPSYLRLLRREIRRFGYFDWRTWSKPDWLTPTAYSVGVVDSDLKPIICSNADTADACQIEIEIEAPK